MQLSWVEWLGILSTVIVLLSFTTTKPLYIRIINSIGSVLFVIYGILIGSLSVSLLNGACILVNGYHICKLIAQRGKQ